MNKGGRRIHSDSDGSTDDLILKDDDVTSSPNGLLTTEPYLNYVIEVPNSNNGKESRFWTKFLIFLVIILLITSILFACLYLHQYHDNITQCSTLNETGRHDYCTTAACVEAAAFMQSAMSKGVNPCEDFYTYSCGGWLLKNPIPDGKSVWSIDSVLWDANLQTMRNILSDKSINKSSFRSEALFNIIKHFRACQNMEAMKKVGAKPLMNIINKVGAFDGSGDNKIDGKKVEELILKLKDHASLTPFFFLSVTIDDKNSKSYIPKFSQSGLGLEIYHYKKSDNDSVIEAYISFLTEIGVKLNLGLSRKKLRKIAEETYHFEKKLSKIFVPAEEQITIEQTYYKTTIRRLQKISTEVNWLKYSQSVFKEVDIKITEDEPILIDSLGYFQKLDQVLRKTPVRIIQNYLLFHVADTYLDLLTEDFIHLSKNLTIAKTGGYKELPRWKTCVSRTDSAMGMALGALFVRHAFANNSYKEANDLVEAVRKAFIGMLSDLDWMDRTTVNAAKEKAESIIQKIGYPLFIMNNTKLDKYYEGLEMGEDTFFDNEKRAMRYHQMVNLKRLRKTVDQSIWFMTPPTINAYYNPSGNQIVFPAGILQAPFFKAGYPKAVNFGSMGSVIGHEITHGFDNNGRLYDKFGNYHGKGNSWWTDSSNKGFKKRTKCFVDQYSNFTVAGGYRVKGNVTLGENIADNGGLKASYKAYRNWVKENGEESLLPGLGRTNDEVFFIAFGQSWCTGELNKRLIGMIETDVHSPFMERVRGSIQNNEDFARVFKCSSTDVMNPPKKCSIW